ncbi:uncharacterized protein TrAFT101_009452 [Trichoderma asperellum]|uniref:RTA1 like protein n=1 Tax=Trichoderma asperellum (strain ATCC 204424 / CBS 433.97 / NBRC 101777) TaxID=1042311 RepID=A0A2T3YQP1_TRIA4|nr:hypothetical protein M441DRAFT_41720 [Trichoderma asperellum CBS 433.97]PTB34837.1 hypothetical protein M441DRAFT_41720 [Trichoderma asperellum CBS 433.97]UKZ94591.1 hypothetical protein TrAFT101_009452 [Trichoderma asperellum]
MSPGALLASQNTTATAPQAIAYDFRLYRYTPSLEVPIVTVVVFAILTGYHAFLIKRHQSFYFTAFTVGGLCYAGRIWSHYDTMAIGGFVIQAILILVAPALYAASIYMILARLIRAINAQQLSILVAGAFRRPEHLTSIIGEKIIITGLFVQIAFFGFFIITTITFHYKLINNPTPAAVARIIRWKRHIYILYTTSSLILVRSIVRVIEYLQGNGGYLISHEAFLYVFDALLMVSVMVIFAIWYIGDLEQEWETVQ